MDIDSSLRRGLNSAATGNRLDRKRHCGEWISGAHGAGALNALRVSRRQYLIHYRAGRW